MLDRYGLWADPDLGAFVGVPNRHQIDFHLAADARAIPSPKPTRRVHHGRLSRLHRVLSPNVYWWRPSGLRRISTLRPDGLRIEVDDELQAVLETLVRR